MSCPESWKKNEEKTPFRPRLGCVCEPMTSHDHQRVTVAVIWSHFCYAMLRRTSCTSCCVISPKNLSRFIEFTAAVSPACDCALVHGRPQMAYIPCSVDGLMIFDLEYVHGFSHAMKMPQVPRPKLLAGNSAQPSSPWLLSSRCDCHPPRRPVRLPSAANRATILQFSNVQATWFECVEMC